MNTNRLIPALAGAFLAVLALGQPARADILISVNKSTQRMIVMVDGQQRYIWPVSTGRPGYDTPNGTFTAFRVDKNHRSEEWDNAPMPYSIFFTTSGDAVHGTYETRGLGRAVSHGCVRLSVKNAATLWDLVKREGVYSTVVQVNGSVGGPRGQMVARSGPVPPATIGTWQGGQRNNQGRQPLFPFFPFGR